MKVMHYIYLSLVFYSIYLYCNMYSTVQPQTIHTVLHCTVHTYRTYMYIYHQVKSFKKEGGKKKRKLDKEKKRKKAKGKGKGKGNI